MRSSIWTSLLLVGRAFAQETVAVCESYSITGTITFTEYRTYYVTPGGVGNTRPTMTIGGSTTSMRSSTRPTSSITRSSTLTSTRTPLLPNDEDDPVTPTIPIPTSSTTRTGSVTSSTISPTTTSSTFVVAFNVPQANAGSLTKRAFLAYLAFEKSNLSILVSSSAEGSLFYLQDSVLRSGDNFVAIAEESEPVRFLLQAARPSKPVEIKIVNGAVLMADVDGYCLLGSQLVVVEDGKEAPTECMAAQPQLIPKAASSSTTATTATVSTTSAIDSSSSSTSVVVTSTGNTVSSSSTDSFTSAPSSTDTTTSATPSITTSDATSTTTSTSSSSTSESLVTPSTTLTSTSSSTSSASTSLSTTSSSEEAVVTNKAYIDTILRHHNRHRANHTTDPLVWNNSLAATAKKIADTCVYGHVVDTDCPSYPDYACYGQNIGAGYLPIQMGAIITDGFYNGEVNFYTYYGGEPDTETLHKWGHFSQIIWKGTKSVGCYTSNCTETGLGKIDPESGIRPYFTVCNYEEPGNYLDEFADNVIQPLNYPTIFADYLCPSDATCEDGAQGVNVNVGAGVKM